MPRVFEVSAFSVYSKFLLALIFISSISCKPPAKNSSSTQEKEDSLFQKEFELSGLKTNTNKHSIPLDSIYEGGPGKNGIPAIDFPEFLSVEQSDALLTEDDYGILFILNGTSKYYPFRILNWHEIVNDHVSGKPVVVTYCPLCGTAMVFERVVDGDTLHFGVSGRLYESNVLMFDDKTESLWSQGLMEAVAGDYTGKQLTLLPSSVVSFSEVRKLFPQAEVLSPNTGYDRNYGDNPYSEYFATGELYFPVSASDDRFPAKEMMYIVQCGEASFAFHWKALQQEGRAVIKSPLCEVEVTVKDNIPHAKKLPDSTELPGYFSMWFSWYAFHGVSSESGVWSSE